MCEMVSRFWSVCRFSVAGFSHEISACREKCPTVYKKPISQTIAGVLMRRRSLQLLSRLRRFRRFPGFSAVWKLNANCRMLQSTHHPEILEFQRLLPHRVTIQTGKSSQVVLSSSTAASASARGSSECDDCQKTADCFSCLSKLCLKSRDRFLCAT